MLALDKLISDTVSVLSASQVMEVQLLQRLLRLDKDQELREGGEKTKLFFHWTSASACDLAEHVIFNGSEESKTTWKNRTRKGFRKVDIFLINGFSSETLLQTGERHIFSVP